MSDTTKLNKHSGIARVPFAGKGGDKWSN